MRIPRLLPAGQSLVIAHFVVCSLPQACQRRAPARASLRASPRPAPLPTGSKPSAQHVREHRRGSHFVRPCSCGSAPNPAWSASESIAGGRTSCAPALVALPQTPLGVRQRDREEYTVSVQLRQRGCPPLVGHDPLPKWSRYLTIIH